MLMIRPVCLPEASDLGLDLTERAGVAAGWGLQAVTYTDTGCGFTMGVSDQTELPDKLNKIHLK